MEDRRKITVQELNEFEKKFGIKIIEVSAKTGEGVERAFKYVIEDLINQKYFLLFII